MDINKQHNIGKKWPIAVMVFFLFIATGIIYRFSVSRMNIVINTPIELPVPLKKIPYQIGEWAGRDVPVDETSMEIAGNNDYLSRSYSDNRNNQSAKIYLGYSARPRTMVGHSPEVCYRANGWIFDSVDQKEFITGGGRRISSLINKFHKTSLEADEIYVLNYYIVNGRITANKEDFSGLGWRMPNIEGNPAWYVAQVQISSKSYITDVNLAEAITDLLLDYLPDGNGKVRAAEQLSKSNLTKTIN